ncbi:MAG: hypothetical protein ACD_46C00501G0002 [uncultured bacterium]|nr:MAG: hypothetical protein ACD_46C00501G0002 [uncultured bacterium]
MKKNKIKMGQRILKDYCNNWLRFYTLGMILIIVGTLAILASAWSTLITILLFGTIFLLTGFVYLIDTFSFWWGKWDGFIIHFLLGTLYIFVGFLLINNPVLGSISITWMLAMFYMIIGLFRLVSSLSMRLPSWGWAFFNGCITVLLGMLILSQWPVSGLYVIGLFVGVDILFTGIAYVAAASTARNVLRKI